MKTRCVFTIIAILCCMSIHAQQVSVVKWNDMQTRFEKNNDTLYVYNFWATWCVPCVKELPAFQQAAKRFESDKVKIIFVSLDFYKSYKTTLLPFIKSHKVNQEVLLLNEPDYDSWISKLDKNWGGDIPATLIIKGKQKTFFAKSFNFNELENTVISLYKN